MTRRDYYRQRHVPKDMDEFCLEHLCGDAYDANVSRWVDTLINDPRSFAAEDLLQFIHHLEFQRLRVPKQHAEAKDVARQQLEHVAIDLPGHPPGQVGDYYKVNVLDSFRFNYMREMAEAAVYRRYFYRMVWECCVAPAGTSFVTSDNPVTILNPAFPPPLSPGIGRVGSMVLYPLTPSWCLRLVHPEGKQNPKPNPAMFVPETPVHTDQIELRHGVPVTGEDTETMNLAMALTATRFVAGSQRGPLEWLREQLRFVPVAESPRTPKPK